VRVIHSIFCGISFKFSGHVPYPEQPMIRITGLPDTTQCFRKVAVHLGYGTYIWLSVSKLPLQCAVVSLYSVAKERLECNTGKVCNCLIQSLLYRRSWKSLTTTFISAQRISERNVQLSPRHSLFYHSVSQIVARGPQVVLGFCPCGSLRLNISPKKREKIKLTWIAYHTL
jgi:hypothetical protein